jgi:hypothetical protein
VLGSLDRHSQIEPAQTPCQEKTWQRAGVTAVSTAMTPAAISRRSSRDWCVNRVS